MSSTTPILWHFVGERKRGKSRVWAICERRLAEGDTDRGEVLVLSVRLVFFQDFGADRSTYRCADCSE
jgi:hypothetical protein